MLYDKVFNTIKQSALTAENSRVIAAVSGGADSVCLLDILIRLSERLGITVECAHVNHNLRGKESDGDEEYVRELCKGYGIKLHTKSVDIMALSCGKSIEDAARTARYDFFEQLCTDENTYIATAHTVNDNTETFFINLLRGSGSRGLCGIPIRRGNIIRPMLEVTRDEILLHLKEAKLSYRTDSTNSDTDYLRNFIRHEIIPVFSSRADINIFKSVTRVTENLQSENAALDRLSRQAMTNDIKELKRLDDALLYRVLTKELEKGYGIILDSTHFEAIKRMLQKGGSKEQIKDDIYAVCEKGKLSFQRLAGKDELIYALKTGENKIGNKVILIKNVTEIYKALTKYHADCDKISGNLFLRTRREGDVFKSPGRVGTSKLSKLLKNDGVSKQQRDRLYVIYDESGGIVFVEGYGVSTDYAASENTQNILSIEII